MSREAILTAIRRGLRPVTTLSHAVAQLDLSQDQRLSEKHVLRELDPMVHSINTLLDRQQEALERERNLANEVAHELRTPLASIVLQAQALASAQDGRAQAEAGRLSGRAERRANSAILAAIGR